LGLKKGEAARSPAAGTPPRLGWPAVALLLLLNLLLFGRILEGGLTYDDFSLVENPEVVEGPVLDPDLLREPLRAVRTLSLRIDHRLFGERTSLYHLQNLIWHILCVLLVGRLGCVVSGRRSAGWLAAALFSVLPVHVEAIANIANRKELLALFFALAASLAHQRALRSRGKPRAGSIAAAGMLWGAAVLSKEVTIVLPLVLALYEGTFVGRERRLLLRRPLVFGGAGAIGAAILAYRVFETVDFGNLRMVSTFGGYEGGAPSWTQVLLTSARAFWTHLRLTAIPYGLSPDHPVTVSRTIVDPVTTLVAWASVFAVVAAVPWMIRRVPVAGFGIGWFLLFYAPTSNLVPLAYLVAERYLYVPSAGLALAGAWGAVHVFHRAGAALGGRRALLIAVPGLLYLTWLAILSASYTGAWRSERALWKRALAVHPDSARAHLHLGVEDFVDGKLDAALRHLERSIALDARSGRAFYNRGRVHDQLGDSRAAVKDYRRALRLRPDSWAPHANLGAIFLEERRLDDALRHLDQAIALHRSHPNAWVNRGAVRLLQGRAELAIRDLEHALVLDPDNATAHRYLAHLYAERGDEARERYHRERSTRDR